MNHWLRYYGIIASLLVVLTVGYFLNRQYFNQRISSIFGAHIVVTSNSSDSHTKVGMATPSNIPKDIVKAVIPNTADAQPSRALLKGAVPVLMYHYIGNLPTNADATRNDLTVSTQNFQAQMNFLLSQGYNSITPDQLYSYLTKGTAIPAKSVIISFDDGYADTFDNAVPILEADHLTGMFGIITGLVATKPTSNYANWQQIISARSAGMAIVSHSYSHPDFAALSASDQNFNIAKSTVDLTGELGMPPIYFIYPYGKYNSITEQTLKNHGYVMSFTTAYGFVKPGENLLELPRVRVHGTESLQTFMCDVAYVCTRQSAASAANSTADTGE
jgi:peptidoglycan/xylan/chitin deacetylase (PgdA/CDA1 family)